VGGVVLVGSLAVVRARALSAQGKITLALSREKPRFRHCRNGAQSIP
jgi:hypothetical protein